MSPEAGIHRRSSHSRKGSLVESPPSASSRPAAPTTFFLRSERDMKQASQAPVMAEDSQPKQETEKTESPTRPQHMEDKSGDKSPVLGTSPDTLAGRKRKAGHSVNPKIKEIAQRIISSEHSASTSRSSSVSSPVQIHSSGSPLRKYLRKTSNTSLNQPHTPLRFSPTPDSGMFSTPRSSSVTSFRLSDEEGSLVDETGSQAIQSSDGEEEEEEEVKDDTLVEEEAQAGASESNMPQLVMPSIAMPSRRPFTGRGKRMGRLKVLVAGQAGVGKTSLIKSILRSCEDIVHVDPVGTSASSILAHSPRRSRSQSDREAYEKTCQITEFNASTKAYPSWWMEMEESRILKRRKSMGDVVLERNICFVDTPGWSQGEFSKEDDIQEGTAHVATYIEGLCRRNAALGTLSDSDLLQMLSGGGGCQVDAVLYLFGSGTRA
ncbi:hypothetical protein H2203_006701 [Taxawa tesnikishii (nom. ined.)]|nr:hypothetical protein H2203_006701 [Dothideales sp. JES 119]